MKKLSKNKKTCLKTPMSTLGAAVLNERKKRGLNQTQLGDFAGTGINFVSALENGKAGLRFDKVLAVMKVLGLELKIQRGSNEIVE